MSRDFDLSDILTITTGRLVSTRHMGGIYDILGFMTGDDLMTHQLVRACGTCAPVLLEQHPQLVAVTAPAWDDVLDVERYAVISAWVRDRKAEFGDRLPVTPLEHWHHMDPLQELAEMTERPDRIIAVVVPDA